MPDGAHILTINGGSSSIKFALYRMAAQPQKELRGKIDRIGLSGTSFAFDDPARKQLGELDIDERDHRSAANFLLGWLDKQIGLSLITAVANRCQTAETRLRAARDRLGSHLGYQRPSGRTVACGQEQVVPAELWQLSTVAHQLAVGPVAH